MCKKIQKLFSINILKFIKTNIALTIISISLLSTACNNNQNTEKEKNQMKEPIAKKIKQELTIHNDTRIDNYYWMKNRDSKDVLQYIKEENDYFKNQLKSTEALQDSLFDEIVGRMKPEESTVPYKSNGYYYYSRYENGKEYKIYCRKKESLDSQEIIVLDENKEAKNYDYYALGGMAVSTNNNLLAYSEDTVSRRIYTIKFKDLNTNELLNDEIPNTSGRVVWANDNKTIYYTEKDPTTLREFIVKRHTLGTDYSQDEIVYQENDETFILGIGKSKSKKYIWIVAYSTLSSECLYIDADENSKPISVLPREKDHEYSVSHKDDSFYILTNWNAKNFRLMKTKISNTNKDNWKEIIPHREDVLLENTEIFDNYLVADERINGLTQLKIINFKDNSEYYLDFGEPAYASGISTNPEFNSKLLRYTYTSLTTPPSTFDYNMETKEKTLLKEKEILGGFDKNNYKTERLFIKARDGVEVPISLVYKNGIMLNGKNPLLLYGYGSYGITMDASFSPDRFSLIDRGFIYAIAHIRGGEELGRQWYENGKLLKKKNTFTDFIDCGNALIEQKFTSSDRLFAYGGSAGGLLMGAIMNMRPEMWAGIIASVPFVDVVTTMLDDSIPLTTGEYDEWGNPNDKQFYDYMLSYSPIDNIENKDYPNLLITTGYHDSQVQYWEPLKWIAKLRDKRANQNLLLLHTQMEAGHGGASGRFKRFKETASKYAFMLHILEKQKTK